MKPRISLQHFKDFDIRFFFLLFLLPSLLQQRVAVDESPGEVEGRNTQCPYRVIDGVRVVLPFENDKTTKQRAPRQPVTREKGNSSSFGCCCFFFQCEENVLCDMHLLRWPRPRTSSFRAQYSTLSLRKTQPNEHSLKINPYLPINCF